MLTFARNFARWLHWHSAPNIERVQTVQWKATRQRELDRCLARFKDSA